MASMFARVAVLGLGLMGGSLALALRAAGLVESLAGYDAAPGVAERAHARGMLDSPYANPADVVAGADLVVLAVPVRATEALLAAIAPALAPGAIVTDLGSTKGAVVAWARTLLPDATRFLGGHPMTGREQSGLDASDATLYSGAIWCLTPTAATDPAVTRRVSALITALGAKPLVLTAERHDRLVAGISHLPLLASVALLRSVMHDAERDDLLRLAAGGLRDVTRLASGDPAMATDIMLTNRDAITAWLDAYIGELRALRSTISASAAPSDSLAPPDDTALSDVFRSARHTRDEWIRERARRDATPADPVGE